MVGRPPEPKRAREVLRNADQRPPVYTVTNKKLRDPTARRLENFWWQVWGSDRRHLSGRTLARLYEDISVGPTIAPLQGPPNRWEGPNVSDDLADVEWRWDLTYQT